MVEATASVWPPFYRVWVSNSILVATSKRLIVARVTITGLGNKRNVETIPYGMLAGVRVRNGLISSSIIFRLAGSVDTGGSAARGSTGWDRISGLGQIDARDLSEFVNRMIARGQST